MFSNTEPAWVFNDGVTCRSSPYVLSVKTAGHGVAIEPFAEEHRDIADADSAVAVIIVGRPLTCRADGPGAEVGIQSRCGDVIQGIVVDPDIVEGTLVEVAPGVGRAEVDVGVALAAELIGIWPARLSHR